MPSSEVRYQRGDHYRPFDEDILRARRSSSTTSSGSKAKRPANGFATTNPKVTTALSPALRYGPPHEYLTKKKVGTPTYLSMHIRESMSDFSNTVFSYRHILSLL